MNAYLKALMPTASIVTELRNVVQKCASGMINAHGQAIHLECQLSFPYPLVHFEGSRIRRHVSGFLGLCV